ncbi:MAG: M48 family metalloprotease [Saprospiraceae bacterium]
MKHILCIATALAAIFLLDSCATVPMTGRQQARLSSEKRLAAMAESEYRNFISQQTLSQDTAQVLLVRDVSYRIIHAARRYYAKNNIGKQFDHFRWEVNLVESDDVNAFCMPGGKIAVMTGMLAVTENEDQLATVIGHEVAHALARHAQEKMSHGLLAQIGHVGVQVATVNSSSDVQQAASLGYVVGAAFGFMLPYSRKLEKEADNIGLRLMIMAGYDPTEAPKLWERMTEKFGDSKTAFFQTHPTNKSRKNELEAQIPAAIAFAAPYMEKLEQQPEAAPAPKPVIAAAPLPASEPARANKAPVSTTPSSTASAFQGAGKKATDEPAAGSYIVVQVEAVNSQSLVPDKYEALKNLGSLDFEPATLEGTSIKRVLLGQFADANKARAALESVRKQGFRNAYLVEYLNGVRGKSIL